MQEVFSVYSVCVGIQREILFPSAAGRAAWESVSVEELLSSLQLGSLTELFQREHITMDVLVEMTNDDLQSIGVDAFGHRHKILRRTKELTCTEEEMGERVCTNFLRRTLFFSVEMCFVFSVQNWVCVCVCVVRVFSRIQSHRRLPSLVPPTQWVWLRPSMWGLS